MENTKVGFTVSLQGTDKTAITDSEGYFYITGIDAVAKDLSLKITKKSHLSRIIQIGNIQDSLQIGTPEAPVEMWAGDLKQDDSINFSDVMAIASTFDSVNGDGYYIYDLTTRKILKEFQE